VTSKNKPPQCPQCGRKNAQPVGDIFKCRKCGAFFDGVDDGIVASHNDPVRSAMAKEERERHPRRKQR
jgi:ribosomal protein L37AE/L43A